MLVFTHILPSPQNPMIILQRTVLFLYTYTFIHCESNTDTSATIKIEA